jgi:3-hydroxymyristoyl/3-hydroxydecanoyl-(acyl carrier protein) dehydratase
MPRPRSFLENVHEADTAGGQDTHRFALSVPDDLCFFEGHFPDFEILPGVAQLCVGVLPRCRQIRPGWTGPRRLTRVKFNRPIRPGDELELVLVFDDARCAARYHIDRGEERCASGRLEFERR